MKPGALGIQDHLLFKNKLLRQNNCFPNNFTT